MTRFPALAALAALVVLAAFPAAASAAATCAFDGASHRLTVTSDVRGEEILVKRNGASIEV